MSHTEDRRSGTGTKGGVIHWATGYDVLAWLLMGGRERAFREKLVRIARLEPGDAVLDVGCGTGTVALVAKRQVGATGVVHGIDPSPEMIARAKKKAARAAADVTFAEAIVEALPYPDARFDVVLSTLMLHHLPRSARQAGAREIRRVLKPGGRALVVDFGPSPHGKRSLIGHFHRHGHVDLRDIIAVLADGGLRVTESGPVGTRNLYFALAAASSDGVSRTVDERPVS
jgi:ubiquinone/menaquinone biosynthesis C-methylase UbiE